MVSASQRPEYFALIQSAEINAIKGNDLKKKVLSLLVVTLRIGNSEWSEKEIAQVIEEGKAVLEAYPDVEKKMREVLGDEWFSSVCVSVITSD